MAEMANCWPMKAEAWDQPKTSPYGIGGDQSGTGTGFFFLITSVFPRQYNSTGVSCQFVHQRCHIISAIKCR
jgi:hypothetical protein